MAGYDGYTSVNTTGRQQWVGFGEAPQTFTASWQTRLLHRSYRIVNHPVRNDKLLLPSTKGRVGLGSYVINDSNGSVSMTGLQFTYAYHILLNNSQLSFGLAGKVLQFRILEDDLTFGDNGNEPLKNGSLKEIGYSPDVDLGIYFTNATYFIGVSANNMFQTANKVGGININDGNDVEENHQILRHYWLMAGYKIRVAEDVFIEPNVLLKTTEQWIPQGDIGLKAYLNEDIWFGAAYRTDMSVIGLFGIKMAGLHIGYAFDFNLGTIQRFNYGTQEVSLSYKFGTNVRRYRWLRRY